MALFVFLAAAARARIVAAYFVAFDHLLVARAAAVAAHKLQLGQFLVLLPLNIAGEILDTGLRRGFLLLGLIRLRLFLFFLFVFIGGERQHRRGVRRALRDLQKE